jgi:hypothetical protein
MYFDTTIVSANVQNNPDLPRWQVREIARDLKPFGVAGLQEIQENGEDARDIKRGLGPKYRLQGAKMHSTPIASKTGQWARVGPPEYIHFHKGDAGIPTPKRGGVAAELRYLKVEAPPRIIFANFHFINSAFNGVRPHTEKRLELWNLSDDILRDWLHTTLSRDITVVLMGDFNNPNSLRYTANQTAIFNGGIDKMFVLPAKGVKATVLHKEHDNTRSDHDALRARVRISW